MLKMSKDFMLLNFKILQLEHFPKTTDKHSLRISYKLNSVQVERIQKKDFALDSWVSNMSILMTNETSCHWFTIYITEPLEPNSKTFDAPQVAKLLD